MGMYDILSNGQYGSCKKCGDNLRFHEDGFCTHCMMSAIKDVLSINNKSGEKLKQERNEQCIS